MNVKKTNRTIRDFIAHLGNYVVHVSTDHLSEIAADAMRLRHDVFCVEYGYEPETTTRQERDEYDPQSCHLVLYDSQSAQPLGCARLVYGVVMPTEDHIDRDSENHPRHFDRDTVAEVSRIVVGSHVRDGRPVLMLIMALMCISHQMRFLKTYACMDHRLTRLVKMMQGMAVTAVSAPFEHKGTRSVSLMDYSELYSDMITQLAGRHDLSKLGSFLRWSEERPLPQAMTQNEALRSGA